MATLIQTKFGQEFYTNLTISQARYEIHEDHEIDVWWCAGRGSRFHEKIWIPPEEVAFIRTESDDG